MDYNLIWVYIKGFYYNNETLVKNVWLFLQLTLISFIFNTFWALGALLIYLIFTDEFSRKWSIQTAFLSFLTILALFISTGKSQHDYTILNNVKFLENDSKYMITFDIDDKKSFRILRSNEYNRLKVCKFEENQIALKNIKIYFSWNGLELEKEKLICKGK